MTKPQLHEDGTFDIKFIEVRKNNQSIIALVETPFEKREYSVSASKDYLDHKTGIPKWKLEIIEMLNKRFEKNFKNSQEVEEHLIDKEEVINSRGN